ncbi:MAG: hypothetical protein ACK5RJ_10635 [Burkholderiales bacterium]|nr:hypothetical protein [Rhodocyclaceae bacterium]MCA3022795.1 hypothetical protein [Rhodocyclaceae bacterium]MCA3044069.1 hypothetical protein [Rhodocyclaceae bacterium]MCA3051574.1 hypothetical protein [Rhodocyclaceae bacterium]
MDKQTVFTKTAKGLAQVNQKPQSLSRQLTNVLRAIDGRTSISLLSDRVGLEVPALEKCLIQLGKDGLIKVFETRVEQPLPPFEDDDLDFTVPGRMAPYLLEPAVTFGPSKYRSPAQNEQVARADKPMPPRQNEAAVVGIESIAQRKQAADARIAVEAMTAASTSAHKVLPEARARSEREAQLRARLEVESRLAEETRNRAEIAAPAQHPSNGPRAEQAAAHKALSENRAKAEAEAITLAVAKVTIESQQKALSEMRTLVKTASKRQEEELAFEQSTLRTQLKAEIEAKVQKFEAIAKARAEIDAKLLLADQEERLRAEMQARLAEIEAEKVRVEIEAREMAEANAAAAAAAAEYAARLKAEEEARRRAAEEAEARRERDAAERQRLEIAVEKVQIEIEARKKAEAKAAAAAAAAAGFAARLKAEEEARRLAEIAASAQRLTDVQQAERAAAQKALVDARARAEAEAKAFTAAREKIETEKKALSEARTQLKEEIEAKVRAELEELIKSDNETGDKAEVAAAIRAEAREEARRQLEEELGVEQSSLAKIEATAKERAEIDAKLMLAEQEERLRAEMQARLAEIEAEKVRVEIEARKMAEANAAAAAAAAAEFAARLKDEEEARRLAEVEAEARREWDAVERQRLEAIARDEAAARATAVADAKAAADAMAAMAERLKAAESETRAEVEAAVAERRKAEMRRTFRLEARLRDEAEKRQRAEAELRAKLDAEATLVEQRIAEEREARELAEAKTYADKRAEEVHRRAQVARLKELNEQAKRSANQLAEVVDGKRKRPKAKKEMPVGTVITLGIAAMIVLALALVQVVPLGVVNTKLEKALTAWAHDDVSSANMRVGLFPKPHVKLDQIMIGKAFDAKAASGKLYMDIGSIFGDKIVIDSLELSDVTITAEALPRALKWADAEGRGSQIEIDKIVLRGLNLDIKGLNLEPFDAELEFDQKGKISRASARTRDGKWSLETSVDLNSRPPEGGIQPWVVDFAARNWTPPLGPGIPFASISGKGSWSGQEIFFPEMEAKLLDGAATGNLRITLPSAPTAKGLLLAQSEFKVARVKVDQLVGAFTRDIALSGRMEGSFVATASAGSIGTLLNSPVLVGALQVGEGSMSNVDLVQAMRNPGSVGGQTKYAELTTKVRVADNVIRFESLKLSGGVLLAGGSVTVGQGALSGKIIAEIRSNVAQDRAVFSLGGNVARPILKRGGW